MCVRVAFSCIVTDFPAEGGLGVHLMSPTESMPRRTDAGCSPTAIAELIIY